MRHRLLQYGIHHEPIGHRDMVWSELTRTGDEIQPLLRIAVRQEGFLHIDDIFRVGFFGDDFNSCRSRRSPSRPSQYHPPKFQAYFINASSGKVTYPAARLWDIDDTAQCYT